MKEKIKIFSIIIFSLILFIGSLIILNGYSKNYKNIDPRGSREIFTSELIKNDTIENATKEKPKNFKCLKCHKGSKSLENLVKEKNINSAEKLKYLIREGPKSGLHITVPDEDLEKAIQYLNLK